MSVSHLLERLASLDSETEEQHVSAQRSSINSEVRNKRNKRFYYEETAVNSERLLLRHHWTERESVCVSAK